MARTWMHWTLAFQGQIRPVSEHDAQVLLERMTVAGGKEAAARRPVGART